MTLQTLSLDKIASLFDGQVDFRRFPDAIQPIRVPASELTLYDPFTRFVATMPGGARLRLRGLLAFMKTSADIIAAALKEGRSALLEHAILISVSQVL